MNSGKVENYRSNSSHGFSASPSPDSTNIADKLKNFSHGDTSALDAPGLVDVIAHCIFKLYRSGQLGETLILLERLGEAAQNGSKTHRERALIVLSMVAEKILEESNEDLLEPIAQMLIRWIKKENEYVAGFEFISLQLSRLIHKMLEQDLWYQVVDLIGVLQDIKKGVIEKNKLIRQVISRAHASITEDSSLNKLTESYIDESNSKREIAGALLTRLSDKSTSYLLQTLAHCDNKEQRFRLLNLIPAAGAEAVPLLLQGLKGDSPWYFTRNILGMLAHIGDPALYNSIHPFLRHGDVRVQQQAVNCITAMETQEKTSRLLEALNTCDHRLKPQIIRALGTSTDGRIGSVYIGLLNSITIFEPNLQNQIVQRICEYLPKYSTKKSFSQLEKLVADGRCRENLNERSLAAIEKACAAVHRTRESDSLPDWIVGIEPAESSY
ncbi:MAG TPA: HEAT repeat domain-containing protein, partial [Desulfopila sp.]|nr:HEAT repeat domain-containing protein [Desulfopila sp.]